MRQGGLGQGENDDHPGGKKVQYLCSVSLLYPPTLYNLKSAFTTLLQPRQQK